MGNTVRPVTKLWLGAGPQPMTTRSQSNRGTEKEEPKSKPVGRAKGNAMTRDSGQRAVNLLLLFRLLSGSDPTHVQLTLL
jgi:hypothetical protein